MSELDEGPLAARESAPATYVTNDHRSDPHATVYLNDGVPIRYLETTGEPVYLVRVWLNERYEVHEAVYKHDRLFSVRRVSPSNNGFGGALVGAAGGAAIGGPVGALVGGLLGLLVGMGMNQDDR